MSRVRDYAGTPEQMRAVVDKLAASGELWSVEPPRWDAAAGKVRVRVWLHPASGQQVQPVRPALPAPRSPRRWPPTSPRWLTPGRILLGAGAVLVVAGCVWGAVRATSGAGQWAASNAGLLVPIVMVVVAGAGLWLARDRGPRPGRGGGHTCPGASLHCPSCRVH